MIILTHELLIAGLSKNGGYNRKQIAILGEEQRRKGWKRRLLGKCVEDKQYELFLLMKDKHVKVQAEPVDDAFEHVKGHRGFLFVQIDSDWVSQFVSSNPLWQNPAFSKLIVWMQANVKDGMIEGSWSAVARRSKVKPRVVGKFRDILMKDGRVREEFFTVLPPR